MLTSSAKAKGRRLQDWVADQLRTVFGVTDLHTVKTAIMGESGADVKLVGQIAKDFLYSIECKYREDLKGVYAMYDQAGSHGGAEPIVFIKMNRVQPLVIVSAEHFIKLVKRANG